MKPQSARRLRYGALAIAGLLQPAGPASADPPIWANAKWVKATITDCGDVRYLVLRSDAVDPPKPPSAAGCTTTEEIYHQLHVAKAFFRAGSKGLVSGANVDAGRIFCGKGEAALTIGPLQEVDRAIRQFPAPRGCSYAKLKFEQVTSLGSIPFANVANGGTMTIAESLAIHAKERERVIAECNASAACRAELRRLNAINTFNECMKPSPITRVCTRPR